MNSASRPEMHWAECLLFSVTLIVVLVFAWLAGPIRWMLAISGLTLLTYLPTLGMVGLYFYRELRDVCLAHWSWIRFLVCWTLLSALINGFVNVPSIVQVSFGFYVLTPFLFGIAIAPLFLLHWRRFLKLAFFLWLLVIVGVVADSMNLDFPWVGMTTSVGNIEVEAAREWHAGASRRLSGFSRASFDAASQIILTLVPLLAVPGNIFVRLILVVVSAYGIVLTTAKGMLLVLAITVPVLLCPKRFYRHLMRISLGGIGFLGLSLPIASLMQEWHFEMKTEFAHLLLFSFEDRLQNMWPEAFQLVFDSGNIALGRGFGGLGVAQSLFEPHRFNAADNIFAYIYVIFGVLGIVLVLWTLVRLIRTRYDNEPNDRMIGGFALAIFVYGLTTNVFEAQVLALTLGIVVRTAFDDEFTKISSKPQQITWKDHDATA